MPVKSLSELTTMACIKNLRCLESVGDYLPYETVRHILLKVENAFQLRQIELNSPQLQGETAEIWIRIIEKDFPLEYKAHAYKPSSPDKWYRVWEKYKKEHDTALEESENKLKTALAGLKEDKEKNTSKIVQRQYLPRAGRTGPRRFLGPRDTTSSTLTFNAGSRTKTHNGASVMKKVRREVKEIATIHGVLAKPIRCPTRSAAAEVKRAPSAMVDDYKRAAQPQYRTSAKCPDTLSAVEQYEKGATFISDSEEDDDDDDDDDSLVETPKKPVPKAPASASATKPATTTPVRGVVSEAAKISLLKKKQAVLRGPSSTKPVAKAQPSAPAKQVIKPATSTTQKHGSSAATASKTAATRGTVLANKFKGAPTKPQPAPDLSAEDATSKQADSPRRAPKSSSRDGSADPSSADELIAALAAEPVQQQPPRKRKAIDIFMRPKKKAG